MLKIVNLPDKTGRLVLRDWSGQSEPYRHNLTLIDSDGEVVWVAELPKLAPPDFFVDVRVDGENIQANTWSCYLVTIERSTGRILDKIFTK